MTFLGVPLMHMPTPPEQGAGRIVSPLSDEGETSEAEKRRLELHEESRVRMLKLHADPEFQAKVRQGYARRRVVKLTAKIEKMQDQMLQMQIELHQAKQESGK